MPNELAGAASPYLRSHADNPVDWRQWGSEPFAEAAARDVPVLVSIGYSTCHWCHVMARESFSDAVVAVFLNDNFVSIKVDREEHAEVDSTYMAAAGAFTGNLGWPLNVFVTPAGRAFFAGTYFPPTPLAGHASFMQVLDAVLDAWRSRRDEVEANGAAIAVALAQSQPLPSGLITAFDAVIGSLSAAEDVSFGGFGTAPKFPVSPVLRFLLEQRGAGRAVAERTLDAMAASPLRDPVDGGFFRYATRRDWSEPHYERMLYDNAQLLASYAMAGRGEVASGIADFLIATMQLADGGFASAQDSESMVDGERVEGFYYSLDAASRARVEAPPLDAKVLTGWNGLAIEGLALAGTLLDRPDFLRSATRAADWLLANHVGADRFVRTSIGGTVSSARATLEDYGMLASGLVQLAISTGEVAYAAAARSLVDESMSAGVQAGVPFGVPGGGDPVLASQGLSVAADGSDGAHPSGLSAVASAAYRLFLLTDDGRYRTAAESAMTTVADGAARQPISFGAALGVMAALAEPVRQVVVIASAGVQDASAQVTRNWHRPGSLVAVSTSAQAAAFAQQGFELFAGRSTVPGVATSYVCENFVCRLPVTSAAELAALLR